MTSDIERDETVVHEIGHRFDLVGEVLGRFSYIDTHSMTQNHAGNDHCIMDYDNDWHDGITEFSTPGILTGRSNTADDSLRDRVDN
jgi:hypothetical protein